MIDFESTVRTFIRAFNNLIVGSGEVLPVYVGSVPPETAKVAMAVQEFAGSGRHVHLTDIEQGAVRVWVRAATVSDAKTMLARLDDELDGFGPGIFTDYMFCLDAARTTNIQRVDDPDTGLPQVFANYSLTMRPVVPADTGEVPEPPPVMITFTTNGQTFQPSIEVTGSPTILWTWSDGTTDDSAAPAAKDFGSAAERTHTLVVTPWSAVTRLDISNCYVTGISTLNILTALEEIDFSYNADLDAINFDECTNLTYCMGYGCSSLDQISVNTLTALTYLNMEACSLDTYEINNLVNLVTLHGSSNQLLALDMPDCPNLHHFCIRSNPTFLDYPDGYVDLSNCVNLAELYIFDCNQRYLDIRTTNLDYCYAHRNVLEGTVDFSGNSGMATLHVFDNLLTGLNLTGCSGLLNLRAYSNALASLDIGDCVLLDYIDVHGNELPEAEIDGILADLDAGGVTGGTAILSGNTPPSAAGEISKASLEAKGWTVTADAGEEPPVENNQFSFVSGMETINMYVSLVAGSTATVTWNFANGSSFVGVDPGEWVAGAGTHTVTLSDPDDLDEIRCERLYHQVTALTGLQNFANFYYLQIYAQDLTNLDVSGLLLLRQCHFRGNDWNTIVSDQIWIDLAANGYVAVEDADIYLGSPVSPEAVTARDTLATWGWDIHEG